MPGMPCSSAFLKSGKKLIRTGAGSAEALYSFFCLGAKERITTRPNDVQSGGRLNAFFRK
jgi:hypothetical protein